MRVSAPLANQQVIHSTLERSCPIQISAVIVALPLKVHTFPQFRIKNCD